MKSYDIAIIPGDGVGKEVAEVATGILNAVADKHGFGVKTTDFDWSCDYYLKHGEMAPENCLDILKDFDAIFFTAQYCFFKRQLGQAFESMRFFLDQVFGRAAANSERGIGEQDRNDHHND